MKTKLLKKCWSFLGVLLLVLSLFTITACKKDDKNDNTPVPETVTIQSTQTSVMVGESILLRSVVTPSEANQAVEWKSSDSAIAKVSPDGMVTGIKEGTVYITVSSTQNKSITHSINIQVLHPLLDLAEYKVEYILCAPGNDASTSININYHTKNKKTKVEYTQATDPNFNNKQIATGDGYYFEDLSDKIAVTFEARNVYHVLIEHLTPNTDYLYRINQGDDTYSEVYSFQTAAGSGNQTSFLFLTDVHYYVKDGGPNGAEISEQTIAKAKEMNPNISFVLGTGDTVDTGGNADIWKIMFQMRQSYKTTPTIDVPGNHEYYVNGTGQSDHRYFAAYNASPHNGPSAKMGSSCYFVHNDTLFIMFDNVKKTGYEEQLAWLEQVLQTVKTKFTIVSMHIPVHYDNTDRNETLMAIFEKYSVDLVLTGHYHGDNFTKDLYEGKTSTDPYLGVTYLTGDAGGVKAIGSGDPAEFAKGYIIDIEGDTITLQCINANGTVINNRSITSKKTAPVVNETKENLIKSIEYNVDGTNNALTFHWSNRFYGNVEKVTIRETLRNQMSAEIFFPTPSYTKKVIQDIVDGYDYAFNFTIYFKDGTTEIIPYYISRKNGINLQATGVTKNAALLRFDAASDDFMFIIDQYKIYVNNQLIATVPYLQSGYTPITAYQLTSLKGKTKYDIKMVAYNSYGEILYMDTTSFTTN